MDEEVHDISRGCCAICSQPFSDGETVVQVVEDKHPTYDKEIVLRSYHKSCCENRETVTHDCPHCTCLFHLSLLRQGEDYQNLALQLFCPFCATLFDCDMGFATRPPAARAMDLATARLNVDRDLLEHQAALLGKAIEGSSLTDDERSCLGGLWEFVHSVLDSMDAAAC